MKIFVENKIKQKKIKKKLFVKNNIAIHIARKVLRYIDALKNSATPNWWWPTDPIKFIKLNFWEFLFSSL